MRPPFSPLACALVAGLAACQTAAPPPQVAKAGAVATTRPFGDRKGWQVVIVEATADTPVHCRGEMTQPGAPAIAFVAGAEESGFTLTGLTNPPPAGGDRITVSFNNGVSRTYDGQTRANGAIDVRYPTARYDEMTFPFARARTAQISGAKAGTIATLDLVGSSWAVNAADECRRINARR